MEEKLALRDTCTISLYRAGQKIDERGTYSIAQLLEEICKIISNTKV